MLFVVLRCLNQYLAKIDIRSNTKVCPLIWPGYSAFSVNDLEAAAAAFIGVVKISPHTK